MEMKVELCGGDTYDIEQGKTLKLEPSGIRIYPDEIFQEVDGFYYFCQRGATGGYLSSWILREIADHLDKINEPWQEEIDYYFREEERKQLAEW